MPHSFRYLMAFNADLVEFCWLFHNLVRTLQTFFSVGLFLISCLDVSSYGVPWDLLPSLIIKEVLGLN
jgi:hypothetical protein